jgi:hypothetical protein
LSSQLSAEAVIHKLLCLGAPFIASVNAGSRLICASRPKVNGRIGAAKRLVNFTSHIIDATTISKGTGDRIQNHAHHTKGRLDPVLQKVVDNFLIPF